MRPKGDLPMSEDVFVMRAFGGERAESKERFQSGAEAIRRLLDSSSDFITLIDKDGTIIEMNEAAARFIVLSIKLNFPVCLHGG